MPVYEYHCDKCAVQFEQHREVSQRASCPCPRCGRSARKAFRPTAIIFKGSGWHCTDYPSSGEAEKAKADTSSSKPEPVAAAKTESKKD
jgi:putative FmdB family regulatory protein